MALDVEEELPGLWLGPAGAPEPGQAWQGLGSAHTGFGSTLIQFGTAAAPRAEPQTGWAWNWV